MVVIVVGVSGSGKTAVGKALAGRLGWAFEDADSWHPASNIEKMRGGIALTDQDREPWIRSLRNAIQHWVAEKRNVVLACSALRESYRGALRAGVSRKESVRFVYLQGTYEEIDRRLRERSGHFMPESLLKSQFAALEAPGSSAAFVVDIRQPVAKIVDVIVTGLQLRSCTKSDF
jgi:gluconokinase